MEGFGVQIGGFALQFLSIQWQPINLPNYQIIGGFIMAIKRPAPKKLSADAIQSITEASSHQTGRNVRVRTYDPDYPVFEIPVNQKVLVYIPNHTITTPDGSTQLLMDKFAAHPVIDGRSYADIRCINGIQNDELGWDGSCPLCDSIGTNWELYNFEYDGVAKSKGIDSKSPEAQELLKQDRLDLIHKMAVKQAEVWYTFPIVVIDCEEKDGQLTVNPKLDSEGKIHGTPMWYSIRERTFEDKWVAGYDSIDINGETPTSPAGLWAILNFTYQPKNGSPTKMDSARALKVSFKQMSESYNQWSEYFDKLTEDWTPQKAMEVVVLDAIRDMDEMKEVTDSIMKPVNERIAIYKLQGGNSNPSAPAGVSASANADAVLQSFGASEVANAGAVPAVPGEVPNTNNLLGEMPNTGVA